MYCPTAKALIKNPEISPSNPLFDYSKQENLQKALTNLSLVSREDNLTGYLNACGRLLEFFSALLNGKKIQKNIQKHATHAPLAAIAHDYINGHYSDSIMTVADLSRQLGVSRVTLTKLFHTELGQTPTEYIQYVRMKHAVTLLNQTELFIQEIAHRVGYSDAIYFSKVFSQNYGVPPSRFRALSHLSNIQPF